MRYADTLDGQALQGHVRGTSRLCPTQLAPILPVEKEVISVEKLLHLQRSFWVHSMLQPSASDPTSERGIYTKKTG